MNPLSKKNNQISTNPSLSSSKEIADNSANSVRQNDSIIKPKEMQQAPVLGPNVVYTRLMRLLSNPQVSLNQKEFEEAIKIDDSQEKKRVLEAIIQNNQITEDIRNQAIFHLADMTQEESIFNKTYTNQNIWDAYEDAKYIKNNETKECFLLKVTKQHVDMNFFNMDMFQRFKGIISQFPESTQFAIYTFLAECKEFNPSARMDILRQLDAPRDYKSKLITDILMKFFKESPSSYDSLSYSMGRFDTILQDDVYVKLAQSQCYYMVRIEAVKNLNSYSNEYKVQLLEGIIKNSVSNFNRILEGLESLPMDLKTSFCSSLAQNDEYQSPARLKIIEMMPDSQEKDEILSVLAFNKQFKIEDQIKLVNLISDEQKRENTLYNLLDTSSYNRFENIDKYANEAAGFEEDHYRNDLRELLNGYDRLPESMKSSEFINKILTKYLQASYPGIDDFFLLDKFFKEENKEHDLEKTSIMLSFAKAVTNYWHSERFPNLQEALTDRFDLFYKTSFLDQNVKKEFILTLLRNKQCPLEFKEYAFTYYLEEYPQDIEAFDHILTVIAADQGIDESLRKDLIGTHVTNELIKEDLLALTEKNAISNIRLKKMKLPSPANNGE